MPIRTDNMLTSVVNAPLKRIGFYLTTAALLFYFVGPYLSFVAGVKAIISLGFAPILVEGLRLAAVFTYQKIKELVQFHAELRLGIALELAIQQQDVNRVSNILANINTASILMPLATRLMIYDRGTESQMLQAIVARLQLIEPQLRTTHNFQLLRDAAANQNEEILRSLLATEDIQNSTTDVDDMAWRALCASCRHGNIAIAEMLLSLPFVLSQVTRGNNRALRLANSFNHLDLVARLLTIPAVGNFAAGQGLQNQEQHQAQTVGFFRRFVQRPRNRQGLEVEERQDNGLRGLGQSFEGAMTPLNERQLQALDDMQNRYREQYDSMGEGAIFNEIKAHLMSEYEKNPARNAQNQALPLQRPVNYALGNNRAYYQHAVHGAYRYLFMRPNPWQSRSSLFRGHIPPLDKTRIAYMWLAATDKTNTLPEGQTHESLLFEFTQAIYELCRAHNFDGTRQVQKRRRNSQTGVEEIYFAEENYDDLRGDKPTCGSGVSQRVTQFYMVFLNDRPETRPLTADLLRTKFKEEMINESVMQGSMYHKLKAMNVNTLNGLKAAMEKKYVLFDDMSPQEEEQISYLDFSQQEISSFNELCKLYYGPKRITQQREGNEKLKLLPSQDLFKSYEALASYMASQAAGLFYLDVTRNIQQLIDNSNLLADASLSEQTLKAPRQNRCS